MHEVRRPDQWTLTLRRAMPLHKFRARDGPGPNCTFAATGEVRAGDHQPRPAAGLDGVIPHWLYFTPLRMNQPLWYDHRLPSELGVVMAVLGLVVGVMRFKPTRPFRVMASIPYAGWMRWHYMTGVVFGVFTLTWVFSGLLSMEPFAWTNATGLEVEREVMTGGPLELPRFPKGKPRRGRR